MRDASRGRHIGVDRLALLLRALWWRRGLSLATLLVAAITIGAGSLGPLYARAADESTLRDRLNDSASQAALHYTFARDISTDGDLEQAIGLGPKPGLIKAYPTTVAAVVIPTLASTAHQVSIGDTGPSTAMAWRDGSCAHFTVTRGRCPTKAGEVIVSERTLQGNYYGWQVGGTLTLSKVAQDLPVGSNQTASVTLTIVGAYQLRSAQDPFWQGRGYFNAHPGSADFPDVVDDIFVDKAELGVLAKPSHVEVQVDYPIDASQVRLADVGKLKADVNNLNAYRADSEDGDSYTTNVLQVLNAAHSEQRLVNLSTLLVSLQLAVLAWLVLFQVIADAVEAKGSEIALAKLRGLRPLATIRFGLAEPLLLVALATPLGLLGGWLSVRLFASAVLVHGTPVAFTSSTFVAVAAALAGSLIAAAAAGRRTLRRSVLEQWRRTPGHQPSALMLALDLILAAAAVVGVVLLRRAGNDGHPHAATLLAPALLVFAVALLGIRLLPLVLRPLLPVTRGSQRIGLFLASRQVVRRPAGLRLATLLAVAVGLASFAIAGEGVAQRNQHARARVEVGAAQLAPVQFEPIHDPIQATHAADPAGTWAMATASWLPDGGGSVTGRVLAVDTSRLAAVAYSGNTDLSTRQLATGLVPASVPPPLAIKATSVRVSITASGLSAGPTPLVQFNLRQPGQPLLNVRAGPLAAGARVYSASVPCTVGCTFSGLTWDRPIDVFDDLTGTVLISKIEIQVDGAWKTLDAGLLSAGGWRKATALGNATDKLSPSREGLIDTFTSRAGGSAGVAHADSPSPLLTIASTYGMTTGPDAPNPLTMSDDTGASAALTVVSRPKVLPSVLDNGVMVDLSAVRAQLPSFDTEATWTIWLGSKAPHDAIARLRAAGLVLDLGTTEHGRLTELGRQGPALALRLLVVCAIVGSILAVGGTAIAIASTGRRRSFELASLRAIGIKRRTLLRASIIEQLLLLGAAMLLGVPAGYLAARISMPSIPEFADATPVALHYEPAIVGVLLFALAFAILLGVTSALAGRALMRAAAPSRLREAE
jgi:putative ABC transport system permease protein